MRNSILAAMAVLMVGSSGALAQLTGSQPARNTQAREDQGSRLLRASKLPKNAQDVRDKGVPDAEVSKALKAAKDKKVPAGEMSDVTEEHSRAIDDHGPTDNFGAFVQGKLNEGLRGRELAAAIRAEHAARGKGKGAIKSKGNRKGGPNADRRRDDEMKARDRGEKGREDGARDRERDAKEREKAAREDRERSDKAAKDAREKGSKGGGQGKGKGKN
jgi:hypothetical protein